MSNYRYSSEKCIHWFAWRCEFVERGFGSRLTAAASRGKVLPTAYQIGSVFHVLLDIFASNYLQVCSQQMSFNLICLCCTNEIDWYILNHCGGLCVLFVWLCFSLCAQVFLNAARTSDLTSQKRQHANSRPGTRNMGVNLHKTQNFIFIKNAKFFSYVNTRDKAHLQSRRNTEVEISMMSSDLNGLY